jgi:hypothetical protein
MIVARLRLMLAAAAGAGLTAAAAVAMESDVGPAAHVGSGLLCSAVPLTALAAWRALRPGPASPTFAEIAQAPAMGQMLHIATWAGIATGASIWTLGAATLDFEGKAGFWLMGPLGMVVGSAMAAATLWSMACPFPVIRADANGIAVGGGLVTPWRDIAAVKVRRSPWAFAHLEIRLTDGTRLRPKLPPTLGHEDVAGLMAVVGRHLPPSEPVGLAQAVQQP